MLILSRKPGDAIIIDGGIRIVVVQCDRGGVRIGIEAPSDVTILRAELLQQVAEHNRRASVVADSSTDALIAPGSALAPKRMLTVENVSPAAGSA
jgi:carbon storage regulator